MYVMFRTYTFGCQIYILQRSFNRKLDRQNQRICWWHEMVNLIINHRFWMINLLLGDCFSSVPFAYRRHPMCVCLSDFKHRYFVPKPYPDRWVDKHNIWFMINHPASGPPTDLKPAHNITSILPSSRSSAEADYLLYHGFTMPQKWSEITPLGRTDRGELVVSINQSSEVACHWCGQPW